MNMAFLVSTPKIRGLFLSLKLLYSNALIEISVKELEVDRRHNPLLALELADRRSEMAKRLINLRLCEIDLMNSVVSTKKAIAQLTVAKTLAQEHLEHLQTSEDTLEVSDKLIRLLDRISRLFA